MGQAAPRAAWVELMAGLAVATAGVAHTIWAFPHELAEVRPSASHGISIIGLLLVARAIGEIAQNLTYVGECAEGEACTPGPWTPFWIQFRRVLTGRPLRWVAGLLIIAGGLGEIVQAYEGTARAGHVYQWGVVLLGLMVIGRAGAQLHEGLGELHEAGVAGWLRPVEAFFERPLVHLAMALALVALAGTELAFPVEGGEWDESAGAPLGAHGLAILGSLGVARALADLVYGAKLAWHMRRTAEPAPGTLELE